uniref:Uncharacterized protein n=1 Tax=Anopheles atroparvus TaxID=41427 RepID=A0AAG5D201_ANOAO
MSILCTDDLQYFSYTCYSLHRFLPTHSRHRYMFDRESASKVDVAVQDGLFLMAVSNSCMNPLVYGSYAMKCRLPCRRRSTPPGAQTPNAAQRRSTDAVSGIIGPHSDRLTGRDNKDELLVADHRSIAMNHLSQNGSIALLQST